MSSPTLCLVAALALAAGQLPGAAVPRSAPAAAPAAAPATQQPQAAVQAPQARITGRVVTWDGRPVAGAGVAFVDPDSITTAELIAAPPHRTDAEGRFELQAPRRSEYPVRSGARVLIAAAGFAALERSVSWKYDDAVPRLPAHLRDRKDHDFGDITLPEGTQLFGRVRDAAGRPVVGALITARDMLDGHRRLRSTSVGCVCRARTDKSGIFKLPATLPNAVRLDAFAAGYYRQQLEPVAKGTPLELTLAPSGAIQGRVLDEVGSGVEGALIYASYERRGDSERCYTGADGSFVLPLEYAGRMRLSFSTSPQYDDEGNVTDAGRKGHSEILVGPQEQLELVAKANEPPEPPRQRLRVRALAAADGTPIEDFRAVAIWHDYALRNESYLDYLAERGLRGAAAPKAGAVEVESPGENMSRTGAVRVVAAGFAPLTQRDVEWKELDDDEAREPLVVRLAKESTVAGRVLDEATGAPVAGARVWAVRWFDPTQGSYGGTQDTPERAVTTGADGAYRIGELGEGRWQLRVEHDERPPMRPETVELGAEEHKADLDLRLATGARVAGRITGMKIPQGTRVFLHELPRTTFSRTSSYFYQSSATPTDTRPLDADGGFAYDGVKLGNYMLVLLLPSAPRGGGELPIPIEPFRVRRDGIEREFDASEDEPGRIAGSVRFAKATVPTDRLVVVAQELTSDPNGRIIMGSNQMSGTRAFVQRDGTFSVPVATGHHRLSLVDVATGIELASTGDGIEARSGAVATADLEAALTEVRLTLVPEADAAPARTPAPADDAADAAVDPDSPPALQVEPTPAPIAAAGGAPAATGPEAAEPAGPGAQDPDDRGADAGAPEAAGGGAAAAATALVDRVEIRFTPKQNNPGAGMVVFGGNDNYDSGIGLPVPAGTTELRFCLPAGSAVLLARNNVTRLRVDKERNNNAPLGRLELEVAPAEAELLESQLPIGAPPEIPAEANAADAKADGN